MCACVCRCVYLFMLLLQRCMFALIVSMCVCVCVDAQEYCNVSSSCAIIVQGMGRPRGDILATEQLLGE